MKLEITMTCILRPQILKNTLESFFDKCKGIDNYKIIANIDPLGYNYYVKDVVDLIKSFNVETKLRTPDKCNWVDAVRWTWNMVTQPVFFNLEDDWVFMREFNAEDIIGLFSQIQNLGYICLRKKSVRGKNSIKIGEQYITIKQQTHGKQFGLQPAFWRKELVQNIIKYLKDGADPEKQISENSNCAPALIDWIGVDYGKTGIYKWVKDIGRKVKKKPIPKRKNKKKPKTKPILKTRAIPLPRVKKIKTPKIRIKPIPKAIPISKVISVKNKTKDQKLVKNIKGRKALVITHYDYGSFSRRRRKK